MAHSLSRKNQEVAVGLAMHRDSMDVAQAIKDYAGRIVRSAKGIGASDRQWLHDLKRDRVSLRAVLRLFELATCADLSDALSGPEAFRGVLVGQMKPTVPAWMDAGRDEEVTNHVGNLAGLRWSETRSEAAADELCESMDAQALASRIFADSVRRAAHERRTIVYARS